MTPAQEVGAGAVILQITASDVCAGTVQFSNEIHVESNPADIVQMLDSAKDLINTSQIAAASAILVALQKSHGHRVVGHVAFRFHALRGYAFRASGEDEDAARSFLRACQFERDTEGSLHLEILAYGLLGEVSRARELASAGIGRFPESAVIASMFVQTAESSPFEALERQFPRHLRDQVDLAIALGHAALKGGNLVAALSYAKIAKNDAPESLDATILLATVEIGVALELHRSRSKELNVESVRNSVQQLKSGIGKLGAPGRNDQIAQLYLNTAVGWNILGERDAEIEALQHAHNLSPSEETRLRLGTSLAIQKRLEEAIAILSPAVSAASPKIVLALSQARAQRNHEGDISAAASLLETYTICIREERPDFRAEWHTTLVKLYWAMKKFDAAKRHLALQDSVKDLNDLRLSWLIARTALYLGDKILALEAASKSASCDVTLIDRDLEVLGDVARIFENLGETHAALKTWKRVLHLPPEVDEVRHVMRLALHGGDEVYVLHLGERLRSANIFDRTAIEIELNVLEVTSSTRSLALIADISLHATEESLVRYLRMRKSRIGLNTRNEGLVERDVSKLPTLDEIEERFVEVAVSAIAQADPNSAIDAAYELFRRNPDSLPNHRAVIQAMGLAVPPRTPTIPSPTAVAPNTAVAIKDSNGDEHVWYVLETASDSKPSLCEIGNSSVAWVALVGKSIGDEIEIPEAFGNKRTWVIEQILDKRVFRFRQCLAHLSTKFPDQMAIKRFHVKEGNSPEQSIGELISMLAKNHARRSSLLEMYRENLAVTLSMLATGTNTPLFFAMGQLAFGSEGVIRCCAGENEEQSIGRQNIQNASAVVVAPSALATAFLVNWAENLDIFLTPDGLDVKFLIAEKTVEDLRLLRSELVDCRPRLGATMIAGRYQANFTDEQDAEKNRDFFLPKIDALLAFVNQRCSVAEGSLLEHFPETQRKDFANAFGRSEAESIEVAVKFNALLWTDDFVVAHFATRNFRCKRVWTQVVCDELVFKRDPTTAQRVRLSLLGLHYDFVSITPFDATAAGVKAGWDFNRQPLKAVFSIFARPDIQIEWFINAAIDMLFAIWAGSILSVNAAMVTRQLLTMITSHPDGPPAIKFIRNYLPSIFGLNVIPLEHLNRVIEAWVNDERHRGGVVL